MEICLPIKTENVYNDDMILNERTQKVSEGVKRAWSEGRLNKDICGKKGTVPWNKGKINVYSKETKKKISHSVSCSLVGKPSRSKGYKHTDEWKQKQAERTKKLWENGNLKGFSPSLETRQKLRQSGMGNQNARKNKT